MCILLIYMQGLGLGACNVEAVKRGYTCLNRDSRWCPPESCDKLHWHMALTNAQPTFARSSIVLTRSAILLCVWRLVILGGSGGLSK